MGKIVATDIPWRYSVKAGSAGNSTAQGSPALSLGKYLSTTAWAGALHDLFPRLEGEDNAGLVSQYRCVFLANLHATNTWLDPRVYFPDGDPSGGATIATWVDSTEASLVGASAAQALEVANDRTAPTGATWATPTSWASGLALGDLLPGRCRAVWFKRTGTNSAALAAPESVLVRARGGTLG